MTPRRHRRSDAPSPQRELDFRARGHRRGGKRAGAGRPKSGRRVGVIHRTRPLHLARHPLHVTMRVVAGLYLRHRDIWNCVRWAMAITVRRADFRICHISIQGNHLHLLVEAEDKRALARGMQGFTISCAKQINRATKRRGRVFSDRYHARALTSPRETRNALVYVLNNFRKHGERHSRGVRHDSFSSAGAFAGWRDAPPVAHPRDVRFPIARAHTWLLDKGWRRAQGPPLDPFTIPAS